MSDLKKAIEEFREKQLAVYRADETRLARDTKAALRATKDHVGHWLLELLQNSDDAEAERVQVEDQERNMQ